MCKWVGFSCISQLTCFKAEEFAKSSLKKLPPRLLNRTKVCSQRLAQAGTFCPAVLTLTLVGIKSKWLIGLALLCCNSFWELLGFCKRENTKPLWGELSKCHISREYLHWLQEIRAVSVMLYDWVSVHSITTGRTFTLVVSERRALFCQQQLISCPGGP